MIPAWAADLNVSRETWEAFECYQALLEKWNPRINLVSKSAMADIGVRHMLDSAQIYPFGRGVGRWVDLGSGGGFPGLVVAIMAKQDTPSRQFTLVESDIRKCAFLRTVAHELGLNVEVISERAESLPKLDAEVLSARALADLTVLFGLCEIHLAPTGRAIFLKGQSWEKEVAAARSQWSFDVDAHKSKTNPNAAVLVFKDIARV